MKRFLSIVCFAVASVAVFAQMQDPVHWAAKVVSVDEESITVQLSATIDEGWHLYDVVMPEDGPRPTKISVRGVEDVEPLPVECELIAAYDENFMLDVGYYSGHANWNITVPTSSVKNHLLQGKVEYMACNDIMCIPPTEWEWELHVNGNSGSGMSLWWLFLMGLLGGLLAIFTPCVWPIIPMTVSFFMKRSGSGKAVREALMYGVAIILIYVVLGLLVTLLFGASALNNIATNAVVNLFFFALLVVFAVSFFGAFEITLPASWSTKLDSKARQTSGVLSILLMAFTLVIVSFSCTGPIIGTLLVEAAGKSLLAPAVGMLGFAIALALPFSLFAMFPQWMKRLPKSGGWMDSFKVVLAFLELALSLKFFSVADLAYGWHLLDREVFLALWIVIFALLGLYLLGMFRFRHEQKAEGISVFRFMLAVVSLSFAMYMVPGLWGAPLKTISAFAPPMSTQDWTVSDNNRQHRLPVDMSLDEVIASAQSEGKTVLLDFSGYGCVNCRKMEAKVLSDERVEQLLENFHVVTLMVDDKTRLDKPLLVIENGKERRLRTVGDKWSYLQRTKFGANAQPYYVKLDADGRQTGSAYSYDEDIDKFIDWLQK